MKFLEFMMQNMGTIVVALILGLVCAAVIIMAVKDKKSGKSSCGGGCRGCPMSGKCHSAPGKEKTE